MEYKKNPIPNNSQYVFLDLDMLSNTTIHTNSLCNIDFQWPGEKWERGESEIFICWPFFAVSSKIELLQMSQTEIDKDKMAKKTTKIERDFSPFIRS